MMSKTHYFYPGILSLLLHSIAATLILLTFNWQIQLQTYKQDNNLDTYLYPAANLQRKIKPISPLSNKASHHSHALLSKSESIETAKPDAVQNATSSAQSIASADSNNSNNKLLAILHAYIQQNQHYPRAALLLSQKGIVRVAFLLDPNGEIEKVKIIRSSHVPSLDHAALEVIQAISPVTEAKYYLQKPENFFIDVRYE